MREEHGYQATDVSVKRVLYAGLGLFVALFVSLALIAGLFQLLAGSREPRAAAETTLREIVPPPPRLQVSPQSEGAQVIARSKGRIEGYAWTDRTHRHARIPIDDAMKLLAARGWPDPTREPGQ